MQKLFFDDINVYNMQVPALQSSFYFVVNHLLAPTGALYMMNRVSQKTKKLNFTLGKLQHKNIAVHLGIAQKAIGPPPPHSNGHSVAPIFGQNHANARFYMDISPKNRCHKPSWQFFTSMFWTDFYLNLHHCIACILTQSVAGVWRVSQYQLAKFHNFAEISVRV